MQIRIVAMAAAIVLTRLSGVAHADSNKPVAGDLDALSCPKASVCFAVGSKSSKGEVVKVQAGTPGTAKLVSGSVSLFAVDCPTVTFCEAVGTGTNGSGVAVTIRRGKPGALHKLTWAPQSVSCPSASMCVLAGASRSSPEKLETALVTSGKIHSPHQKKVSSAYTAGLGRVSCPKAGDCEAIGSYTTSQLASHSVYVHLGAGAAFGTVHQTKNAQLMDIDCPHSSGRVCRVLAETSTAVLMSLKVGGSSLTKLGSASPYLQTLSCLQLAACTSSGYDDQQKPVIVSFDNGQAGPVQRVNLHGQYFTDVRRTTASAWVAVGNDSGGANHSRVVAGTVA
jgi:hypothetical protein